MTPVIHIPFFENLIIIDLFFSSCMIKTSTVEVGRSQIMQNFVSHIREFGFYSTTMGIGGLSVRPPLCICLL